MKFFLLLIPASLLLVQSASAQANLPIYTDNLVNGFQDWSWAARNLSNTSPVQSGTHSISFLGNEWDGLEFEQSGFNSSYYTNLTFWMNGGTTGGQVVQVAGTVGHTTQVNYVLPALPANAWQAFTVPLSALGLANQTNATGVLFQLTSSGRTNSFYIDSIQLTAVPSPALTHLTVNAAQPLRTVDSRWFGVNTAIWDTYLDTAQDVSELQEAGFQTLRFPGGSASDDYHWADSTPSWETSFTQFAQVATNLHANVFITANYGTGTPAEAAAWVKSSNVNNKYGFKYWEIGNEVYGTWETDSNTYPNDPYTYATRAAAYMQQMKAVDPTIKTGVVVVTGEDNNANGYTNHPATNPVTHQAHNGWTPVLLSTLKKLGYTPDFVIYHWYPEYTGDESDPLLLQGTSNWVSDAADLRSQLNDYYGAAATNIEICCTENNSNSGDQGKQSVSLVNGLYYADSLCQLMTTEINSFIWWDLRNSTNYSDANLDPTLYGWRMYGDLGLMNGLGVALNERYPQYFTAKLMQHFVRGGDTILNTSSDYGLLTAYGARRTNGALTLLVANKNPVKNFNAQIDLNGFTPSSSATIYSYGMPQDNAAQTGVGSCDIAQTNFSSAAATFDYTFAPYSVTVFSFAPSAPSLSAATSASGDLVLQLIGQPGASYTLETSTDLVTWSPVSTNSLTGSSINVTNTIPSDQAAHFWRALWQEN